MVSKGSPHLKDFYLILLSSMHYGEQRKPHLKDFYLTLLSSMHYGEQRKPSLERYLPHIIVLQCIKVSKGSPHFKNSTSHYSLQCIMVSKGSLHLKNSTSHYCSSMHYGEQRKPSHERFLPHIIVLQCIMVSKGSPHLKDFYLTLLSSMHYGEQRKPSLSWKENYMFLGKAYLLGIYCLSTRKNMNVVTIL